jgi:cytochrome P450
MQATAKNLFPKADSFNIVLEPIIGGPNLLSMSNQEWKEWKALLNPGFRPRYLLDPLLDIWTSVETFCDKPKERAGTVFCLEELATRMTMHIIVKVTLRVRRLRW